MSIFPSLSSARSLLFLVLLLPASRNLARVGYEIFSQFFLDPSDAFSLPIFSVLWEEKDPPSVPKRFYYARCTKRGVEFTKDVHVDAYFARILYPKQVKGSKAAKIEDSRRRNIRGPMWIQKSRTMLSYSVQLLQVSHCLNFWNTLANKSKDKPHED